MTDCHKYREMISAIIDGELSENERKLLSDHLAGCEQCSRLLVELREQRNLFSNHTKATLPLAIENVILDKTSSRSPRRTPIGKFISSSYLIPKPVAWVAGALIIALAVFDLLLPAFRESDSSGYGTTQFYPQKIQKVIITDKDIVKTQTYSEKNNL